MQSPMALTCLLAYQKDKFATVAHTALNRNTDRLPSRRAHVEIMLQWTTHKTPWYRTGFTVD